MGSSKSKQAAAAAGATASKTVSEPPKVTPQSAGSSSPVRPASSTKVSSPLPTPPVASNASCCNIAAGSVIDPKLMPPPAPLHSNTCVELKIFDCVNTVYGPGYIKEVRATDYVVLLTNWALAQGQSPTLYLSRAAITKVPGCFPGSVVSTVYGPARVNKIRGDNTHICTPINWSLANGCRATLYLQPNVISLTQTPGFNDGDEVMTVYGQGYVEGKRVKEGDLVIKLRHWALAQGQSPTCYLHPSACVKIPGFTIGAVAKTVFGLVKIKDILRDGKHVCEAIHWKLADGTSPILYLAPESFALLSLKP